MKKLTDLEERMLETLRLVLEYLTPGRKTEKREYRELVGEIRNRIAEAEGFKRPGGIPW